MLSNTVLIVEDDPDLREAIAETLEMHDIASLQVADGEQALAVLAQHRIGLVLSDVNMPRLDGYQLLRKISSGWPQIPVLIMTAFGSIANAVEAMRNGAVEYLEKPFASERLLSVVRKYLPVPVPSSEEEPVAVDAETRRTFLMADRVAATDSTVLITGESGTGKEVLARYIHRHSTRVEGPFIAINCAAIPENMLEATLFGHEKGAFTGAYQANPGKFEQANGGTLLLDEITEMDVALQAKLLRVLQEREVERVGGRRTIALDVRIIATTNRNLREAVEAGKFREDLYYRLNVFPLRWKPLRERRDDILPIAERMIRKKQDPSQPPVVLESCARERLLQHDWPGNIRELDNVIQRALILCCGGCIRAEDIFMPEEEDLDLDLETDLSLDEHSDQGGLLGEDLRRREFEVIMETLKQEGGSKKNAAERLGISPRTLRYKMARMRDAGMLA
jgi:two-component system response regulator FlrC